MNRNLTFETILSLIALFVSNCSGIPSTINNLQDVPKHQVVNDFYSMKGVTTTPTPASEGWSEALNVLEIIYEGSADVYARVASSVVNIHVVQIDQLIMGVVDLQAALRDLQPGEEVTMTILRENKQLTVSIKLGNQS